VTRLAGSGTTAPTERLVALDLMRGLVMVLMAIDHSSDAFNAGRLFTDSAAFYRPGTQLPTAQFLVRWITHLCAPTFLFLAGTGLAFTVKKLRQQQKSEFAIDRHLLIRGLIIAGFELWISYFVMPKGKFLFQVLYAIGTSYLLMIPLRRLPTVFTLGVSIALILLLELLGDLLRVKFGAEPPLWATLLVLPGNPKPLIVAYPTLHWLALMLLGWSFGRYLLLRAPTPARLSRSLAGVGGLLLLGFVLCRGLDGYGNMALHRADNSLVQWLHVSKYPPSLSYISLELGICFLCLAALFRGTQRINFKASNLLMVLGQTPMFFYLLHFPLLVRGAQLLGVEGKLGLGATFLAAAAVILVLYPACRGYRRYKATHKQGFAQYI
jgi:uncharacterized membrane protein